MTIRPSPLKLKSIALIVVLILSLIQNLRNYTQITELENQIDALSVTITGYVSSIESLENIK